MNSIGKAFEDAAERHEHIARGTRFIPLISAIMAVLAAVGTLASHHRSIEALSLKNEAILTTAKASDQFTAYQTKRVRVALYSTLLSADLITNPKARADAKTSLDHEGASSLAVFQDAKTLEARAQAEQERSEVLMTTFVTLEVATTLFEIGLVLSSISAMTESRILLWVAGAVGVVGAILLPIGYFQGH